MSDLSFILTLLSHNRDSLLAVDPEIVRHHFIPRNNFILARNIDHLEIGFLLHSTPRPNCAVRLDAICITLDHRRKEFGRHLVEMLLARAAQSEAAMVITSCPAALPDVDFFPTIGFRRTHQSEGCLETSRPVNHYSIAIPAKLTPPNRPSGPRSRWNGYLPRTANGR